MIKFKCIFQENDGIFSFGSNLSGQLGLGEKIKEIQSTPQQVIFFNKMKVNQISCGCFHNLALTAGIELKLIFLNIR